MKKLTTQSAYIGWLDSSLEGFIADLRKEVSRLVPPEALNSVSLDLVKEYDYGNSEGTPRIEVTWERLETDKEQKKREENEVRAKKWREDQYKALKREFE